MVRKILIVVGCAVAGFVVAVTATADQRPVVSGFRFAPASFAAGSSGAQGGTTMRFRLSERATVRVAVARRLPGRVSNHRCVKPTQRLSKRRACTRLVSVGRIRLGGQSTGRHSLAFRGQVGGRALAIGRYRASLVAVDRHHHKSKARHANFTVVAGAGPTPSPAPPPAPAPPTNPANVGVPAGWVPAQTRSTNLTVSTAGAVVQDILFTNGAQLNIDAPNVTVRRVRLQGGMINTSSPGVVIEDSTLDRTSPETNGGEGVISYCGYTARRVAILDRNEGFRESGDGCGPTTIENSFVRIVPPASCLNGSNTDWHGDGLQGYDGTDLHVTNLTIDFQAGNPPGDCGGTSPFFYNGGSGGSPNGHAVINGLLIKGGGFSFRMGTPGSVRGLKIVNNSWGYGPISINDSGCGAISPWEAKIVEVDANWNVTRTVRDLPCQ